ncbi:hypothetical protein CPC08DRAFT_767742 [Agrocybe pediades]|nr:hypothetical protein CPC08DRAFT_767742 [Agrocybe pediades]
MTDPLSITLAAITLGTALKDLTELALKLHGSFKQHAHNMRAAESLAADTLDIVQAIENFYIARGDVLNNLPDVRDAVERLSKDMQSVYDQCLPILQSASSPERGLRRTLLMIQLWRGRKEVESNIHNLREKANKCYRRFTRDTQLGTVVAIGELKSAVSEVSATARKLSALQVSDENVLAFMGSTRAVLSTLPPGVMLSEDLIFKLCVRGHVGKIDNLLKNLALKRSYAVEEPNDCHIQPFTIKSLLPPRTPAAIEYAQSDTLAGLIKVQQGLLSVEAGRNPIQEGAWALNRLSADLGLLEMYSESVILSTWSVDLYRTLSISNRDVYAPRLALAFFNLALLSYKKGDFTQAITMTTNSLSLLKACAPTFATEALKARVLSSSAHFRCALGEHSSAPLQDAEDSVAMFERLGADQMAVIGPVPAENYSNFGVMRLRVEDSVVRDYAFALDAQRTYLYASQRYQEALDAGMKALQLYRALGRSYEHVQFQSRLATSCLFLCDDVFREVIPLSSALKYVQEALQIWEELHQITETRSNILDSLAVQTKILIEMGQPSNALMVFQKLAKRVRVMDTSHRMYIHKLQDLTAIFVKKMRYVEAATASRTIVEICRQGLDSLPTFQRSLIHILLDHTRHCDYANHLSEALICSQEALAIARQKRMKGTAFTPHYLLCVVETAYLSLHTGHSEQVIHLCQDALNVISHCGGYGSHRLDLLSLKAFAYLRLGRLSLAAATITEGYDFLESTTPNLQEEAYYGELLHVSALVDRCGGKQDDALAAFKAAIPIFDSINREKPLYVLSHLQADVGLDAEALRTAEESVRITEHHASSSSPSANHIYKMSQYSLCLQLFFHGDFNRARQLILEVRSFYEWHSHSRDAFFTNLARALRAEGILECASDRHAEGELARTRLNELQRRLRATFPGLANQVDVALNYERNYPAWRRLLKKYPPTCSHWIEDEAITGQEYIITHSHPTTHSA